MEASSDGTPVVVVPLSVGLPVLLVGPGRSVNAGIPLGMPLERRVVVVPSLLSAGWLVRRLSLDLRVVLFPFPGMSGIWAALSSMRTARPTVAKSTQAFMLAAEFWTGV